MYRSHFGSSCSVRAVARVYSLASCFQSMEMPFDWMKPVDFPVLDSPTAGRAPTANKKSRDSGVGSYPTPLSTHLASADNPAPQNNKMTGDDTDEAPPKQPKQPEQPKPPKQPKERIIPCPTKTPWYMAMTNFPCTKTIVAPMAPVPYAEYPLIFSTQFGRIFACPPCTAAEFKCAMGRLLQNIVLLKMLAATICGFSFSTPPTTYHAQKFSNLHLKIFLDFLTAAAEHGAEFYVKSFWAINGIIQDLRPITAMIQKGFLVKNFHLHLDNNLSNASNVMEFLRWLGIEHETVGSVLVRISGNPGQHAALEVASEMSNIVAVISNSFMKDDVGKLIHVMIHLQGALSSSDVTFSYQEPRTPNAEATFSGVQQRYQIEHFIKTPRFRTQGDAKRSRKNALASAE